MSGYDISVLPTAGAVFSVKSYCQCESEGYYGADIAFYELANNIHRFEGFMSQMKRLPVQSFWSYTMEGGLVFAFERKQPVCIKPVTQLQLFIDRLVNLEVPGG